MPLVKTVITIPRVSRHRVWQVLCDFERYPALMEDVVDVRWLKPVAAETESSWKVLLNGSELTWIEKDTFIERQRIEFDQIEGDLEVFRGHWRLDESDDGVTVTLEVEFDLGIPSLAEILDPIGIQAIKSNSRQMLSAIRSESHDGEEAGTPE